MRIEPVFLFDLAGTLVDSVYQHVLAWKQALDSEGIELSVWRIHRKIGMSGGLFADQLVRETGRSIDDDRRERLRYKHAEAYMGMAGAISPLPGAKDLLAFLTAAGIRWAIATSGRMETAAVNIAALGVDPAQVPVVTRDQVKYAKPDPDLFLAAAERLGAPIPLGGTSNHFRTRSSTRDCSSGVRIDAVSSRSFTARSMSEASSLPAIARLNQK